MEAQIAVMRAEFEIEQAEATTTMEQDQMRTTVLTSDRTRMSRMRQSDPVAVGRKAERN